MGVLKLAKPLLAALYIYSRPHLEQIRSFEYLHELSSSLTSYIGGVKPPKMANCYMSGLELEQPRQTRVIIVLWILFQAKLLRFQICHL